MPELWVQSPVGVHMKSNNVSLPLFLPPFPLKNLKKKKKKKKFTAIDPNLQFLIEMVVDTYLQLKATYRELRIEIGEIFRAKFCLRRCPLIHLFIIFI